MSFKFSFFFNINFNINNVLCFGGNTGQVQALATGGTWPYSYNIGQGSQVSSLFTNLSAGLFSLTITDANACTYTQNFNVQEPSQLAVSLSATLVSCYGGNDGAIYSTPIGGTSPYSFLWSNTSIDQNPQNLAAGNYTLTLTDANACTISLISNVAQPPALISQSAIVPVGCFGGNSGSASVNPAGGTAGYSYLWSNAAMTPTTNTLSSGWQYITVTDANGCVRKDSLNLNPSVGLTVQFL